MVNGINGINTQPAQASPAKIKNPIADKHLMKLMKHGNNSFKGDTVSLNNEAEKIKEYTKDAGTEVSADYQALQSLVNKFFQQQGISGNIDTGETTVSIMDLTPEKARDLVSEDGYWGVEQTSDRIVDFAISTAGNDRNNLDKIKDGINNGMEMAKEAFGGTLPEISQQTYNAVMDKLDAWASNSTEQSPDSPGKEDIATPTPSSP